MYERFTELVNDQAIYDKIFSNLANDRTKALLKQDDERPRPSAEVARMRSILFTKRQLADDLYTIMAYGGLIHHFKNYLLRGDEKDIDAFNQDFSGYQQGLERLPKTDTHLRNDQAGFGRAE